MCVRVWLGDLTAGKLVIELLILSDLTARLAFLFYFMLHFIFSAKLREGAICHPGKSADNSPLRTFMRVKGT